MCACDYETYSILGNVHIALSSVNPLSANFILDPPKWSPEYFCIPSKSCTYTQDPI